MSINKPIELTNGIPKSKTLDDSRLSEQNVIKVKKNPGLGEFSSINDALSSITDNSTTNRYLIKVSTGEYTETPITMKPYVSIIGVSYSGVFIKASTTTDTIITMVQASVLDSVTITGASGVGGKAVYSSGTSTVPAVVRNCQFGENETHVECFASSGNATIFVSGCISGQQIFTYGFKATNTSTGVARILLDNHSNNILAGQAPIYMGYTSGATSGITVSKGIFRVFPITGRDGFIAENGAELRFNVSTLRGFDKAFHIPNTGTASKLYVQGGWATDSLTYDLLIEQPSAIGIFEGNAERSKLLIPDASSFFVRNKDLKKILVSKKGGDYTTIADAIAAITDSSPTNPYIISVGPGIFTEVNPIIVPIDVSIVGSDINATIISPVNTNQHLFEMRNKSSLNFMTLRGVAGSIGSGKAAIHAEDSGDFVQFHKLSIYDFDIGIYNHATTNESIMYVEYVDISGDYSFAVKNHSVSTNLAEMHLENFYTYPSNGTDPVHIHSEGLGAQLILNSAGINGGSDNIGIEIFDGGLAALSDVLFSDFTGSIGIAFLNPNTGSGSTINLTSSQFIGNANDVSILNPDSSISLNITADPQKISIASGVEISSLIADSTSTGVVTLGEIRQGPTLESLTPIGTLISETGTTGVYEGGAVSAGTGLSIVVAAGKGFCYDVTNNYIAQVIWPTTTLSSLTANTNYWISVSSSGTVAAETSNPGLVNKVYLTRIRTGASSILWVGAGLMKSKNYGNLIEGFARNIGAIYLSGSLVTENGTRGLDVSSGKYQFGTVHVTPSGGTAVSWTSVTKDGSGSYTFTPSISQVDNTNYDDGSGTPVAMTTEYYRKDALYTSGAGAAEKLFLVRGQVEFSSLVNAEGGNIPTPPDWFTGTICLIATIIVQKSATNLTQIRSERPLLSFQASGVSAASVHSNLSSLSADDHPQYLLVSGTRAMTSNLDMGTNNITNVGTVDGVDISAHASRHLPNGADPLTTGTPSDIGSANAAGIANAFARQDHVHNMPNIGTAGTYGEADKYISITTDAKGRVTSVTPSLISIIASQVSNFASAVASSVLSTVLTGISFATGSEVVSTDSILVAIGKLQSQITNIAGPSSDEISTTTSLTTTSTGTRALLTGFTTTPTSGTYLFMFSGTVRHSAASGAVNIALNVNGTEKADSLRSIQQPSNGTASRPYTIALTSKVTVNGSQDVQIRWNLTGAGTGTLVAGTMNWIKVS